MMASQQADSLRRVLDRVFESRAYDWVPDRDPWAWLRRAWSAFVLWLHDLEQANPLGFRLLAYGAVLVLLLIVGHAIWILVRTVRAGPHASNTVTGTDERARDAAWYRQAAHDLAGAGRFREAMEADFQALLLALEERAVLRVQASTTPAEYARQVRLSPDASAAFTATVNRLYGYLFARWPCGPDEYATWQPTTDPDRYAPAH
ncbi:MAG TPA: DUF4129 domain-containing protein [Gemmatimonadales bacterium]|nr:DUF4129 domain-containing protein [Gemmatimonadales bacterium]